MKKRILALACALCLSTFQTTKPNPTALAWRLAQLTSGGFAIYTGAKLLKDLREGTLPKDISKAHALFILSTIAVASYTTGTAGLSGFLDALAS